MKTALTGVAMAAMTTASTYAQDVTITIPGPLPDGEICESVWSEAESPEDAVVVFVAALLTYEFNEEASRDCMARIVDEGYLDSRGELSQSFEYLIEVGIERHPEIARSYVDGATPQNGYALPEEGGWDIVFTRDARFDLGNDEYRVKVYTSGQPTSRPVTVRRDEDGLMWIKEASTLFVGVFAAE